MQTISNKLEPSLTEVREAPVSKKLDIDDIDIVLYHGWCPDGYGSAFVIWYYYCNKFGINRASNIKYYGCTYDTNEFTQNTLNQYTNKNIIICDFSFDYKKTLQILQVCKSLMIVDHHATAEKNLVELPNIYKKISMNKSGVGLVWELFYPNKPLPRFMEYLQDHDLWTGKYEETAYFNAFLDSQQFKFDVWGKFMNEEYLSECLNTGRLYNEYKLINVGRIAKQCKYLIHEIDDEYYLVGYCNTSIFKSEVGNTVFKYYPFLDFACVWNYDSYHNTGYISLRSIDTKTNVSNIAEKMGGGGHRNASGVTINNFNGVLPFTVVNNKELIDCLIKPDTFDIKIGSETMACTKIKLCTDSLKIFTTAKYQQLLKRIFSKSNLIVFQTTDPSNVTLADDMETIINLNTFTILWNETSLPDQVMQLYHAVCASKTLLSFSSEREFQDIFTELASINNSLDKSNTSTNI